MANSSYVRREAIVAGIEPDTIDLYLQRFGGLVVIHELTSVQVAQSARLGVIDIASSEGTMQVSDPIVRQCLQVALCLYAREPVEGNPDETRLVPMFGTDAASVLPKLDAIQRLGWRDHLLLVEVLERLTDGRLTPEDRTFLKQEHTTLEQLDWLKLEGQTPAAVAQAATDEGEVAAVMAAALRVPEVLFGKVPMGVVRQLAAQLEHERDQLADAIAQRLAMILIPSTEA